MPIKRYCAGVEENRVTEKFFLAPQSNGFTRAFGYQRTNDHHRTASLKLLEPFFDDVIRGSVHCKMRVSKPMKFLSLFLASFCSNAASLRPGRFSTVSIMSTHGRFHLRRRCNGPRKLPDANSKYKNTCPITFEPRKTRAVKVDALNSCSAYKINDDVHSLLCATRLFYIMQHG